MAAARRAQAPPARRRAGARRKGWSRPDERYGPRRLRALYEIGNVLSRFAETPEATVPALLPILTRELPLRSAILIEKTKDEPTAIVWHAPDATQRELKAAAARASKAFSFLTRSAAPVVKVIAAGDAPPALPAERPAPDPARHGRYITCPLAMQGRPIFGSLHLEGVEPFDEEDLEFVNAATTQLAVALERNEVRLHEIALRKEAETSQLRAQRETESRRRAEQEVRELNADLERRVAQRTAQFQDTIEELRAFTYSVAHDLRAPLRHIHGFTQLLIGAAADDASREHARRIMAASEGMDALIKDLLAYSRLTLDEIKVAPVPLDTVLALAGARVERELSRRKARLEVSGPLPTVLGHEASLVQAATNLIANALKFSAPGVEPLIRVTAEARGTRTRLWVEDNGIGIAPEHLERIFGVFQRLHKVEDYPGTGIGLAIVRRALSRMNGTAGAESEPGKGSRFWIELETATGP